MTKPPARQPQFALADRRELVVQMRSVSRYAPEAQLGRALTAVSFEVWRGEVLGLLGPGRSGKSALLQILAGRVPPTEGKVRVFGRSPRRRAVQARIGYLPQSRGGAPRGLLGKALVALEGLFNRRPGPAAVTSARLQSDGAERRNLLRQAFAKKPELLLLDEPFVGLEPAACNDLKEMLRAYAQQGRTVILSSASLVDAQDLCGRLVILFRGRIEATGTLPQLLAARENLRHLADLLPEASTERILDLARRELGVAKPATQPAADLPQADLATLTAGPLPGETQRPQTADTSLAPLARAPVPKASAAKEPASEVNHQMLVALTRSAVEGSTLQSEANQHPSAKPVQHTQGPPGQPAPGKNQG